MNLEAALHAVAHNAPQSALDGLRALTAGTPALATSARIAALLGQCAVESGGFKRLEENLTYTTAARLMAVWPSRFVSEASAAPYVRNQEALANKVYGGRMGNVDEGDGWKYRGRGYLQLTGRDNYRSFGLENAPETAAEPETAWRIAAEFLATRSRNGKTALEWADENDPRMVTRIVNGGTHALDDRRRLTAIALEALG